MKQVNIKKLVILNLPYLLIGLYASKLGQAYRLAAGADLSAKLLHIGDGFAAAFTKQEKTTDIWFDEKDPLIHIRTHNTDLKNRLTAYAAAHPGECRQTDADPETGCMEFVIRKGRFSFRLTVPYSEERREAARRYARENNAADRLK